MQSAATQPEMDERTTAIIRELAKELAAKIGPQATADILLSRQEIFGELKNQAEERISKEEDARKAKEAAIQKEVIRIGMDMLGLTTAQKAPHLHLVQQPAAPAPSAWQTYLNDKGDNFLPPAFYRLGTNEEASAARGLLIGVFQSHRRHPSWVASEMAEAVKDWFQKAQDFLDKINLFFRGQDIPRASDEDFRRVSDLLRKESELVWFFEGPESSRRKQEKDKRSQEKAEQRNQEKAERRKKKETLVSQLKNLLLEAGISHEKAEKLANSAVKKFSGKESREILAEMAILRQVEAIRRDKSFTTKLATEAEPYALAAGLRLADLLEKANRHPESAESIRRADPRFGEMSPDKSKKGKKQGNKKKGRN